MRAYTSSSVPGWQVGLQGLSDTLGGTAEFQRETEATRARTGLAQQELQQRQREEARRHEAFQFERDQALRKISAQESANQARYGMVQADLAKRQQSLLSEMMGGPATVDQDQEMRQLDTLARNISPDNAEALFNEYRGQQANKTSVAALQALSQDVMRPVTEGAVQDPQVQQQLQMIGQASAQLSQMVQSGGVAPDDVPRLMDQIMERQEAVLKDYAKKQADLQQRQMTMQAIEVHKQGLQPGDPRFRKLSEAQQLVGLKLMDERQVGLMLMADQFGIPPEKVQAFLDVVAQQEAAQALSDQQARMTDNSKVSPLVGQISQRAGGATREFLGAQPATNGQAAPPAMDAKASFAKAVSQIKNPTPEQIRIIARRFGVTDLTPEDEEVLFGGG